MTNSTTAVVKVDAWVDDNQERADQASDAFMIGVDTDGREHFFSRIRDWVTVIVVDSLAMKFRFRKQSTPTNR